MLIGSATVKGERGSRNTVEISGLIGIVEYYPRT